MKIRTLQIAIMAAALVMAVQAHASFFDITFTGSGTDEGNIGNGVVTDGNGSLTATANGGGTYTVIAGTFDVTAGPGLLGDYSLVANPNAPGTSQINVPGGYFVYDDQLSYPATPYVTDVNGNNGGLLFYSSGNGGTYLQIDNIGTPYETWNVWNSGYTYAEAQGTLTVTEVTTAVPEPTTMIAGALLLLPFGASTLRLLRKTHTA
jgi:hypothetical protein